MIKTSALLAEVKRIQTDMPDVVYEQRFEELGGDLSNGNALCMYAVKDNPGCIVGLALFNMGASLSDLNKYDLAEDAPSSDISTVIQYFSEDFEYDDADAIIALSRVQRDQDRAIPWGKCGGLAV